MAKPIFPTPSPPQNNVTLRRAQHPWRSLLALVVFTIIWNAIAFTVTYFVVHDQDGFWRWFVLLFPGVGILLLGASIYQFIRTLILSRIFGEPTVLVTVHPLRIGESFRAAAGQLIKTDVVIQRAKLSLLAEEVVIWRRGTTTYTDRRQIFKQEHVQEDVVRDGQLLQVAGDFQIPPTTMHSLEANNNKVHWKLVYEVEVAACPDVHEEFELSVIPRRAPEAPVPNAPLLSRRVIRAHKGLQMKIEIEPGPFGDEARHPLGGSVQGALVIDAAERINCRGIVLDLTWSTSGKGDPEEHTVWQERLHEGPIEMGIHRLPFTIALPLGPAAYDGELMHLVWEVRAWVDLALRRDPGVAQPLWLVPAGD